MANVYSLVCWGGSVGKTVTLSIASPCVMTNTAHSARDTLKVQFSSSGALPTGIDAGVTYYVKSTGANTANLYTDEALTIIVNTSGTQSGTHTAKSVNMVTLVATYPTRYGPTGADRIYSDANSCNNARIANATAEDDDVIEFCDQMDDSRATQLQISTSGYARTTLWTSEINGIRSDAFHFGNPDKGFRAIVTSTNGAVSGGAYNVTVDGLQWCRNTSSATTGGIAVISGVSMVFKNNIVRCLGTGTGPGIQISISETETYNNIVLDCKGTTYGGLSFNASSGAFAYNNLVTKCDLGINANTSSGSALCYNNLVIGNTQNYGGAFVFAANRMRRNIGEIVDKSTFTVTAASTSMTLATAPPFNINQQITFSSTGTLPTVGGVELSSSRSYFVRSITGSVITIGLTYNGAALTFDGVGTGVHTVPFSWESVNGAIVEYIDFTTPGDVFVDWDNNDFRPAGTAPTPGVAANQIDYGINVTGMVPLDMDGNERPSYKNGDAEYWDVGPFEFDYGYTRPSTDARGIEFTELVAGSKVKVFVNGSDTEKFSAASSGTTETWSETLTGSISVDYTIQKAGYLPIRVTGITVTKGPSGIQTTPVSQVVARWYEASSGLTINTNAFANATTKKFGLTTTSTLQNLASYLLEQWIDLGDTGEAYANKAFPIEANGPNSFTWLDGWEADLATYANTITNLSRDGMRYLNASGEMTASWSALLSAGVPSGLLVRFQQVEGNAPTDAAATGNIDQLIQVFGDATHGNFDYRGFMVCKVQEQGYDQSSVDVVSQYGSLEDQLYVIALLPLENGVAADNPTISDITITDHGASPVTWNAKQFSITISDAGTTSGEDILQAIRYAQDMGGTFQGENAFNWHDLVQVNGSKFKGVRGSVLGDVGATLKGVRVLRGADAHPDFTLHTSDDGATVSTTPPAQATATILANSRIQLYNINTAAELDNSFISGTSYTNTLVSGVSIGDALRLRVCKLGYEEAESSAVWTANGASFLVPQSVSDIYNTWGIDGSTVTEFSLDGPNLQIDANDIDGATTKTRVGAFYNYALTTEVGIRQFYGALSFLSTAAIRVNVDIANVFIENTNPTTALRFTDLDVRLYKSDGTSIIAASSYSIHNDYSGVPDVVETGVSGLTGSESAQLMSLPTSSGIVSALSSTNLPVDVVLFNGAPIEGDGTPGNDWRGSGVQPSVV